MKLADAKGPGLLPSDMSVWALVSVVPDGGLSEALMAALAPYAPVFSASYTAFSLIGGVGGLFSPLEGAGCWGGGGKLKLGGGKPGDAWGGE